jgi:hypothetical protein
MKKSLILLTISLMLLITSCQSVERIPYWELVPPPERPRLVNLSNDPLRQSTMNLNLLVNHVYRWENWYEQLTSY